MNDRANVWLEVFAQKQRVAKSFTSDRPALESCVVQSDGIAGKSGTFLLWPGAILEGSSSTNSLILNEWSATLP